VILQELVRYYERKSSADEAELAPEGFEYKEIPFVIVLDPDGRFRQIQDTRSGEGNSRRSARFLVPQAVKKTSGVAANLLWDTCEYVLGVRCKSKPERVREQHDAFLARLNTLRVDDAGLCAIRAFLENIPVGEMGKSPHWPELAEQNPNLTFRLTEDTFPVCGREAVFCAIRQATGQVTDDSRGICLATGEETTIQRLHPAIKGVRGAQSSGANIVSFNLRAFESYGKEQRQGENAPVGKYAAFAYTTALNHLLGKDSRQKMPVGDATVVFWSRSTSHLEDSLSVLLGEPPKDDPDANVREVEALFRSIEQGSLNISDSENTFFVLGLSPNASRISIRFWLTGTVREFSERIAKHFQSTEICRGPRDPRYLSLFRLLVSTAQQGKADNIPPNLAGDTLRAILSGQFYPETLLAAALRRIRAEREVNYPRAALVKACLNRAPRSPGSAEEEELKVSLDITNTNSGYRLGRLFAALEKIQEDASSGLNATIRDRFYGAASSTPITVFATLMKLSKHHLAKVAADRPGLAITRERLLGEINSDLDGNAGFPAHLSLADQGRFAIGYYHQKQSFYTKKSEGDQQ